MSAYITKAQFIAGYIAESELVRLTNDGYDSEDVVNDTMLNGIISSASSSDIDSKIKEMYTLPLVAVHPLITDVCGKIVRYKLYSRLPNIPDVATNEYKNAMSILTEIENGTFMLEGESAAEETGLIFKTNASKQNRRFTRDFFERYNG